MLGVRTEKAEDRVRQRRSTGCGEKKKKKKNRSGINSKYLKKLGLLFVYLNCKAMQLVLLVYLLQNCTISDVDKMYINNNNNNSNNVGK